MADLPSQGPGSLLSALKARIWERRGHLRAEDTLQKVNIDPVVWPPGRLFSSTNQVVFRSSRFSTSDDVVHGDWEWSEKDRETFEGANPTERSSCQQISVCH